MKLPNIKRKKRKRKEKEKETVESGFEANIHD